MAKIEKVRILLAIAVLAFVLALAIIAFGTGSKADAAGQAIQCTDSTLQLPSSSTGYNRGCAAAATTSPIYLGNGITGATSTILQAYVGHTTFADVNLDAVASSSASIILFTIWYSNDNSNWYQQSVATTSFTTGITTVQPNLNMWTPGVTTSKLLNLHLSNIGANYVRVQAGGTTASSSVYAQLIQSNPTTN